jgi:hypothetical protein
MLTRIIHVPMWLSRMKGLTELAWQLLCYHIPKRLVAPEIKEPESYTDQSYYR